MTDILKMMQAEKSTAKPIAGAANSVRRGEGGSAARAVARRDSDKAAQQLKDDTTGWDLVGASQVDGGIGIVHRQVQQMPLLRDAPADWEFPKDFQERMEELGIHHSQWGIFEKAVSDEHFDLLASFALQNQQVQETRAQFGLMANLAAGLTDPVATGMDLLTGGLTRARHAGRLGNALRSGGVAGGLNLGLSWGASQTDSDITLTDHAAAAGLGLVLGGAFGARRGADWEPKFTKEQVDAFMKKDVTGDQSLSAAKVKGLHDRQAPGLSEREVSDVLQEHIDRGVDEAHILPAFEKVRFSLAAQMTKASQHETVRAIGRWLYRDGVGYTDKNIAVKTSAGERSALYRAKFETPVRTAWNASIRAIRDERGLKAWDFEAFQQASREMADGLRGIKSDSPGVNMAVQQFRKVLDDVHELGVKSGVLSPGSKAENYFPQIQSRAAYQRMFGTEVGLSEDQAVEIYTESIFRRMKQDAPDGGAGYEKMLDASDSYAGTSPQATRARATGDELETQLGEQQKALKKAEADLKALGADADPPKLRKAKKRVNEANRKLQKIDERFKKAREDLKRALEEEDASNYRVKQAKTQVGDGGVDRELAEAFARALIKRGAGQLDGADAGLVRGISLDDIDGLRSMLHEAGVTGIKAESLLAPYVKRAADGAQLGANKQRIRLDPSYRTTVTNRYGKEIEVGVTDFMENDVNKVLPRYIRDITGWSAMSELGNVRNPTEWAALKKLAMNQTRDIGGNPDSVGRMMDIGLNSILGRSTEANPNSIGSRMGRFLRDTQFARVMNQVGFTQFSEFGPVIAYAGLKNTLSSMRVMGDYLRRAADGTLEHAEARWLEELIGPGTDSLRNPAFMRLGNDGFAPPIGGDNSIARGVDNATQYANRATSYLSGMAPLNTMLQRVAGRATLLRLMDFANAKKLDVGTQTRLRNWGLDAEDQAALFGALRGKKSISDIIETDLDMPTRQRLQDFMYRVTRHQVLEGDASDSMLLMHTAGGRIVSQFRSFMVFSYERHFLNSAYNYKDWATWHMVTLSAGLAGMQWTARTYLNTIGDAERRKKQLTKENFLKNASAMSSWGSVIPAITDTVMQVTGNEAVFEGSRASGMSNSLITGSPVIDFVDKAASAAKLPAKALRTDQSVTRRDAEDFAKLLWFQNLTGWQNVQNQAFDAVQKHTGYLPEKDEELSKKKRDKNREEKRRKKTEEPFLGIFY